MSALTLAAARRHRLTEWVGTNRLPGELHVRHWRLGAEISGLDQRRESGLPRGLRGTSGFYRVDDDADRLVRIDVLEQPSRVDAHEALPAVLAEVQAPVVNRDVGLGLGDVAFTTDGGQLVLFARANLLVLVVRAGRERVDVPSLARALDRSIVSVGSPARRAEGTPPLGALTVFTEEGDVRRLEVTLPPDVLTSGTPLIKVFAPPGRLYEENGQLLYRPSDGARGPIRVAAREPGRAGVVERWIGLETWIGSEDPR